MSEPSDNLIDLLRSRAANDGSRTAYTFLEDGQKETGELTFAELDVAARRIGSLLQGRVQRGDRALLVIPSSLAFLEAFFGCLYAGVIPVPLYPPRRNRIDQRISAVAADAEASVAITTNQILADLKRRLENAQQLKQLTWLSVDAKHSFDSDVSLEPIANPKDLAFLQYTSGSTATPKGVMISHANLIANLSVMDACWHHTRNSVLVSWLPTFHDMGLIYGMLQPLFGGFRCCFMPPAVFFQQPITWLQAISRYRGTHSAAPNFAYDWCVQHARPEHVGRLELSSWEFAINGAEPVRAVTLERFYETFRRCGLKKNVICPGYGLAEATLAVSTVRHSAMPATRSVSAPALAANRIVEVSPDDQHAVTIVGCGAPVPGTDIAIVDPDSRQRFGTARVGEIWVRGPSIARGYWGRDDETRQTFGAELTDVSDATFLRTGDLGFMKNGELFVTGRLKDMIIIRGQNTYPQDVELTVEQSHPALRQNCGAAFGVEVRGEERLVVVQELQRTAIRGVDSGAVIQAIRQSVQDQHALEVHAVALLRTASLPKTSSGKIQRHASRERFLNGSLITVAEWRETGDDADGCGPMDYADAAFFGVDSEATPQVIAAVCVLDRPPDMHLIESRLADAVESFPRLRQKVVRHPRLAWAVDTEFQLSRHVEVIHSDSIQSRDALLAALRPLIGSPPPRERPPWQAVVITNGSDQSCLILRTHHAFTDGVRLVRLLEAITSPARESQRWGRVKSDEVHSRPSRGFLATVQHAARCSWKLLGEWIVHCGTSALNGVNSGHRTLTVDELPRADLVRVMRHFQGSLHDVIFTALAGGIRRYQDRRGERNEDLRLIVPMSIPPQRAKGGLGNHLVISALTLPVSEADAGRRLKAVRERFARMKSDGTIGAYEFAAAVVHCGIPVRWHRAVWESMLRRTTAICTVLLGPQKERFVGGSRIESIYGVPGAVVGHGAAFAFVSYAGKICASIVSDDGVIGDAADLMNDFVSEFSEMLSQTEERGTHIAELSGIRAVVSCDPLLDLVRAQVAQVLGRDADDDVPHDEKLADLGLDSMLAVELQLRLESHMDCQLPKTLVVDHPTIAALAAALADHGATSPAVNVED